MITQGSERGYNYYNCTGTVQCRHRRRPLSGLCLVTSSVSYQGVIFVLHSRLTLSYRHRVLSNGCPKGKKSGGPTVPASGIATGRQGGHDQCPGVRGPWSLAVRVTKPRKSSSTRSTRETR